MNNAKKFPKSRVFVVDVFPYFKKGVKEALDFNTKHNISQNSPDGKRVFVGYVLKNIRDNCKQIKADYPVVLCLSKKQLNRKLETFAESTFNVITKFLPHPFCGTYDLDSPDLELAAESRLQQNTQRTQLKEAAQKLKLKVVDVD